MPATKADIVAGLQREILQLQGFKPAASGAADLALGPLAEAFPNHTFPVGAVHEFLSNGPETMAATTGFIAGLLSPLMQSGGVSLWISAARKIFPPALSTFGLQPDRFIFVDLQKERDVLWVMDEALKCGALTAVVGEVHDLDFTASRRLQLAVEQSHVTGFVLRPVPRKITATACVSRWKISPRPSAPAGDLPGVGFPQWSVELLRMRNGRTGKWEMGWEGGRFTHVDHGGQQYLQPQKKTG